MAESNAKAAAEESKAKAATEETKAKAAEETKAKAEEEKKAPAEAPKQLTAKEREELKKKEVERLMELQKPLVVDRYEFLDAMTDEEKQALEDFAKDLRTPEEEGGDEIRDDFMTGLEEAFT